MQSVRMMKLGGGEEFQRDEFLELRDIREDIEAMRENEFYRKDKEPKQYVGLWKYFLSELTGRRLKCYITPTGSGCAGPRPCRSSRRSGISRGSGASAS